MFLSGIPTTPLEKNLKEVNVSPAYLTTTLKRHESCDLAGGTFPVDGSASGWGLGSSFTYGLSSHFGLGVMAVYESDSGELYQIGQFTGSTLTSVVSEQMDSHGFAVSANLIMDPFIDPKGFRWPLFIGFAVTRLTERGSAPGWSRSVDYPSTAVAMGTSPQFNTGPFRWILSAGFISFQGDTVRRYNGASETAQEAAGGGAFQVVYRPWNLSASIMRAGGGGAGNALKPTVYNLSWKRRL